MQNQALSTYNFLLTHSLKTNRIPRNPTSRTCHPQKMSPENSFPPLPKPRQNPLQNQEHQNQEPQVSLE